MYSKKDKMYILEMPENGAGMENGMKNVVIMQARVGSSRLHAKVLKELCGKTILEHDIERIRQAKTIDDIIVATTTSPHDDAIEDVAIRCGVKLFRGSENDVLDRYYQAAKKYNVDNIVRITSDCPLIDPHVIDDVVKCFDDGEYEVITNVPNDAKFTYPRGMDVEEFSFEWLEKAWKEATDKYDREHVSPYIYDHAVRKCYFQYDKDYSQYRWTLDTEEDWKVIQNIYEHFYHGKHDFYLEDIVKYVQDNPDISKINEMVKQKLKH